MHLQIEPARLGNANSDEEFAGIDADDTVTEDPAEIVTSIDEDDTVTGSSLRTVRDSDHYADSSPEPQPLAVGRTRSSHRNSSPPPPQIFSPNPIAARRIKNRTENFTLNRATAMRKICTSTTRSPIEVVNKKDNIIVNCTPTSFLLLRNYVKAAIEANDTLVITDIKSSEDQTSANVMDVIKVQNQEKHTAVINIYPTTHRFMINGKYCIVENVFNDTITMITNNPDVKKMYSDIRSTL